ncbi:MAG TPA: hypothetical protein VGC34_11505, partial [Steroidobacteraceae bacterium]
DQEYITTPHCSHTLCCRLASFYGAAPASLARYCATWNESSGRRRDLSGTQACDNLIKNQ